MMPIKGNRRMGSKAVASKATHSLIHHNAIHKATPNANWVVPVNGKPGAHQSKKQINGPRGRAILRKERLMQTKQGQKLRIANHPSYFAHEQEL
jgi:hypothetical protein